MNREEFIQENEKERGSVKQIKFEHCYTVYQAYRYAILRDCILDRFDILLPLHYTALNIVYPVRVKKYMLVMCWWRGVSLSSIAADGQPDIAVSEWVRLDV